MQFAIGGHLWYTVNMDTKKVKDQLGMSYSTARYRLRNELLFCALKKLGENVCYRCGKPLESTNDIAIDHKKPWLDIDPDLFWDLDNIAFSHIVCNSRNKRPSIFASPRYCVWYHKTRRKWTGYAVIPGSKKKFTGYHDTKDEAEIMSVKVLEKLVRATKGIEPSASGVPPSPQ